MTCRAWSIYLVLYRKSVCWSLVYTMSQTRPFLKATFRKMHVRGSSFKFYTLTASSQEGKKPEIPTKKIPIYSHMEYFTAIKRSKVLVDVTCMMLSQVEQKTPDTKENHVVPFTWNSRTSKNIWQKLAQWKLLVAGYKVPRGVFCSIAKSTSWPVRRHWLPWPSIRNCTSPTEKYLESATKFNQTLKKQACYQHLEGNYSQDFSLLFSGLFLFPFNGFKPTEKLQK